ncbi:MAG TPA: hypothetical protein VG847_11475 [Chitinophagaceae bacterium]|nr:hypothetical protein [Chitinophagaceae bacterium]
MKHSKIVGWFSAIVLLVSACQKEYSIEGTAPVTQVGSWQFMNNSILYTGVMDSAYIDTTSGTPSLHLTGTSSDGIEKFNMVLYGNSFVPGEYKASLFQSVFQYTSGSANIYTAGQLTGEFIVTITSINGTSVSGTFSGSAQNVSNATTQITDGKFTASFSSQSGTGASSGVLGNTAGNCTPVTFSGIYAQGQPLDSSNTVQVQVTVATTGSYTIKSNTVNGVTFSQSGNFVSTGVQTVTLKGSGTPIASGDQDFTISYGNSQCNFKVTFAVPASGTLGSGGGNCTPFSIAGNYQQGLALNVTNTVQIQVNVSSVGAYNISTNSVNGVVFAASGLFVNTGIQTVTLTGSGIPLNSGAQNYTVTFGNSACNFSIAFQAPVTSSNDYFPLTANSNWTYALQSGTSSDSLHAVVIGYAPVFAGTAYNTIAYYNDPFTNPAYDSGYYRKPGGDYYQYINYSQYIPFDQPVVGEYVFLKDNVPAGTVWNSPTVSGTISNIAVTAYIKMTLLQKAVPASVGAFNFPDVIEVQYEYFISGNPNALISNVRWFAKNVGEIYDDYNDLSLTGTYNITGYQVF